MMRSLLAPTFLAFLASCRAICPHEDGSFDLWSEVGTWEDGSVPGDGHIVHINSSVLLASTTRRLGGVVIGDGGRLVFDPTADLAKLITDYVLIKDNGAMEIGSADCKFEGNADILLTGIRSEDLDIGEFGQKFIGVEAGGSLEIHGQDKLSWTKLDSTLYKKNKLFSTLESGEPSNKGGAVLYEFKSNGDLIQVIENIRSINNMTDAVNSVQVNSVVIVSVRNAMTWEIFNNRDAFMSAIENGLLQGADVLNMDQLTTRGEAWTIIVDTSDPSSLQEAYDVMSGSSDPDGTVTDLLTLKVGNVVFNTFSSSRLNRNGVDKVFIDVYADDYFEHSISVVDDVSSWKVGDKFVIASTDFDYKQAEEFVVESVSGNTITFIEEVLYDHYGEIYESVDMRAEVGLLTRNVKIHGEMQDACYSPTVNECDKYSFDNFGGHTKAEKDFKAYNIEGAELFHMGQTTRLGSYPIHFHLCLDTDANGTNPLIKSNAIYRTFNRAITIHASHGVHIKDNVAYDHIGHGYFLEDGGEKRTLFEHNLGLSTKKGSLTNSDSRASTFWITSPLTTMIGNSAAGGEHTGIWYLFPDIPARPSDSLNLFQNKEAKHTPIDPFLDNAAHSNADSGMGFFRRLSENHGIIGCSTYTPRVTPLSRKSELQPITMDGFTGYKNRKVNVRMRSAVANLVNFHLAESIDNLILVRNMLGGYQLLADSVIVGETPNTGAGGRIRVTNPNGSRSWVDHDASVPLTNDPYRPLAGVRFRAEGPSHIHNVTFLNFRHNEYRKAAAMLWTDDYPFHNGATTSSKDLTFNFQDPDEGYRMWEQSQREGRGDTTVGIRDLDGTLTGQVGTVFKEDQYFTTNQQCTAMPGWNMEVCQGNYAKFYLWPSVSDHDATFITDDNHNLISWQNTRNLRISYTVADQENVIMHWNVTMPNSMTVRMAGLEYGQSARIGFCLPPETVNVTSSRLFSLETDLNEASSLAELDSDTTGMNLFFDRSLAIVYRKFTATQERADDDLADCAGGFKIDACPRILIRVSRADNPDMNDGDCRTRGPIA